MRRSAFFLLLFWIGLGTGFAQQSSKQQKQLEAQRLQLKNEIKQINSLLFSNTKTRKNALSEVEDLQVKLNVRSKLIKVTNQQANLLTRRIGLNERTIADQRKELESLKAEYAKMIQKSYASKSLQNRLMFLFSSENFLQAYKRIQYLKQYARYRRKQGIAIAEKTTLLQELNKTLTQEKATKLALVEENRAVQEELEKERKQQQNLIKTLKRKERSLAAQIAKKQKQRKAIDREINRLIREAIAASNKAAGKKGNKTFQLTPEAKLIAANFQANKGRLPWPLKKGVVIQGFGRQQHPVVKTTTIQSNGVVLATEASAQVRAVFEGEVMSVIVIKGSNPSVLIRHGNFITLYTNLAKLYVKKGEKVAAKQPIGEVFTNQQTGKTQLQFGIFNNVKALNPKDWVYQM
ncbi:peptidoglycan DD-metalloendopeptidase family protein [Flavobacteriaceae bacterium]|jgi:septal ring factor EnvC (AmiA/AmiB activator)|nr:peptidoglycan DD-metalloendopeptidase family protein [Flavobacteriaceae bacterium]MDC0917263.1 peptidoglycan DD-metalloendopeptidase family protein [Flavobacteriaceae bacterium]MDC3330286.1 peptidoglycan DD-metalloendopeptidase family protein [Flavobacteriaceae bacterium]